MAGTNSHLQSLDNGEINDQNGDAVLCSGDASVRVVCHGSCKKMKRKAIRTQALVTAATPLGGNGQRVLEVEFAHTDGRVIRYHAQRHGSYCAGVGDRVDILYTGRKIMGVESWNIFILSKPDANPFAVYTFAGSLLLAVTVVLAAAALMM